MSQSRQVLVSQYDIKEEGLKKLIDDLCQQPEEPKNMRLVQCALRGTYSDFGSSEVMPSTLLIAHLQSAALRYDSYNALIKKAEQGEYDHNYGPQPSASHPSPEQANQHFQAQKQSFADSMNFVMEWIKSDIAAKENGQQVDEKKDNVASSTMKPNL